MNQKQILGCTIYPRALPDVRYVVTSTGNGLMWYRSEATGRRYSEEANTIMHLVRQGDICVERN